MSKKKPTAPRVNSFEERMKREGELVENVEVYICGCGCDLWFLAANGDCVCADCYTAQARIIVSELAPVSSKGDH